MEPTTIPLIAAEVAARLRAARARADLTGADVQGRGGPHAVTLSRYEGGQFPTLDALYRLATIYGVKIHDLLPLAEVSQ